METRSIKIKMADGVNVQVPLVTTHTVVLGSGAAGLNAAARLKLSGVDDLIIVTEGLDMGTSINTGSDKQTYYKLAMYGNDSDAPLAMAESLFAGGSMHGDLALVESALSARAFMNLVNLGVPFPSDEFGQYVGYKTDHDPRQRATSTGPYTSRDMCLALISQVKALGIPVHEKTYAVELLVSGKTLNGRPCKSVCGVIAVDAEGSFIVYAAENVVFALGGPGGLYSTSVYPSVHTGGIGLAMMAGAMSRNLPESQYGLASTRFRWNVSGTYMQVVPRFISTDASGGGEAVEFMREFFKTPGELHSNVFLKGYQWPFDSRKVVGGSSIIDLLVYIETVIRKRRVFLDYRSEPEGFAFDGLSDEARTYLERSRAITALPIERLKIMNPASIELYRKNGIDIEREPLEIAVCAQHNNGGLAANAWWESENIMGLFPVGEVNGSHGVARPGGSALNSGQVGGFRAAEYIAARRSGKTHDPEAVEKLALATLSGLLEWTGNCRKAASSWRDHRKSFQDRMSRAGAHIRSVPELRGAVREAREQWDLISKSGSGFTDNPGMVEALRNRHLCFAHMVYLEAVLYALESGVGSRGSSVVTGQGGVAIHDQLGDEWRIAPENTDFRGKVLETIAVPGAATLNRWVDRRPMPDCKAWFENAWAAYRSGAIYGNS